MKTRSLIALAAFSLIGALGAPSLGAQPLGSGPILAQSATPPTPGKKDDPPVVVTYLVMILLVGGIIGANLIPSKRGHQD